MSTGRQVRKWTKALAVGLYTKDTSVITSVQLLAPDT